MKTLQSPLVQKKDELRVSPYSPDLNSLRNAKSPLSTNMDTPFDTLQGQLPLKKVDSGSPQKHRVREEKKKGMKSAGALNVQP